MERRTRITSNLQDVDAASWRWHSRKHSGSPVALLRLLLARCAGGASLGRQTARRAAVGWTRVLLTRAPLPHGLWLHIIKHVHACAAPRCSMPRPLVLIAHAGLVCDRGWPRQNWDREARCRTHEPAVDAAGGLRIRSRWRQGRDLRPA